MSGELKPRSQHALAPPVFLLVVCVITVASARWPGLAEAMAASPARVAHGRLWLVLTSGLLAEHPVGASIVSFVLLAMLAYAMCGRRTFWLAAAGGHVGATLIVYAVIAVARVGDRGAFSSVFWSHDYGVSAVSAAWLGAVATIGWRVRGRSLAGRAAIALSCVAVGLFAYTMRPGLTIIASEHVIAFAIGIGITARVFRPASDAARLRSLWSAFVESSAWTRRALPSALRKVDPVALVAGATTLVLVAGAAMPTALGALGETIASSSRPTVGRCVSAWNRSFAPRVPVVAGVPVLVTPARAQVRNAGGKRVRLDVCSYLVMRGGAVGTIVAGRFNRGTITAWESARRTRAELPTNASVRVDGLLQLDPTPHAPRA